MKFPKKSPLYSSLIFCILVATQVHGGKYGSSSMSIDTNGEPLTRCDQITVRFEDSPALTAEEQVSLPAGSPVDMTAPRNGGIHVTGWTGDHYEVTLCKAAASGSPSLLSGIHSQASAGRFEVSGPSEEGWTVYLLVKAPAAAQMTLHAQNGPIGLQEVRGTFSARAENGPISLKNNSATIDAYTQNGPISLAGGSGKVKLDAQNGPVSVKLDSSSWENGSLEARTQNGPVSLKLPHEFSSGVLVESAGHSPVSCRCDGARETRTDDSYRVEFGSASSTVVHLSTKNGPVSIKND